MQSRDGVVSTCLGVPPVLGDRFFRACLHALLRTSAVVVHHGVSECEVHLCAVSDPFYVPVYNHCPCVVLAWLCVSEPRYVPQLGPSIKKHVIKVGSVDDVCNVPSPFFLSNSIWLNTPNRCPESRRIVFLNLSDPCGRCASQLAVVVQPPEFSSPSPAQILASLRVTWLSSMATQYRHCACPEHGASCASVWS